MRSRIQVIETELDAVSARALLERHHVGRLAVSLRDRIRIVLMNYVCSGNWIYARMEPGPILKTIMHSQWVAFEVDEIDSVYDWRVVTVNGSTHFLAEGDDPAEFDAATRLFQSVVPEVLTLDDPLPERVKLLRIYIDELRGLEMRSRLRDDRAT